MGLGEIIVLGIALSADAFAVTISNCFVYASERKRKLMLMPIMFGLFQMLMPIAGYFVGGFAAEVIEQYSGIVTLVILGFIGGNMVREGAMALMGLGEDEAGPAAGGPVAKRLTFAEVFVQAIATAIDAFAVGVSLRAQSVDIVLSASIIGLTTFVCCCIALGIGRRLGHLLGDYAEIVGGLVLVGIGIKAFLGL